MGEQRQAAIDEFNKQVDKINSSPVGLTSPSIFLSKILVLEFNRLKEIDEASLRYTKANKEIPKEWKMEYNRIAKSYNSNVEEYQRAEKVETEAWENFLKVNNVLQ